jgi:hypothetical protein
VITTCGRIVRATADAAVPANTKVSFAQNAIASENLVLGALS